MELPINQIIIGDNVQVMKALPQMRKSSIKANVIYRGKV